MASPRSLRCASHLTDAAMGVPDTAIGPVPAVRSDTGTGSGGRPYGYGRRGGDGRLPPIHHAYQRTRARLLTHRGVRHVGSFRPASHFEGSTSCGSTAARATRAYGGSSTRSVWWPSHSPHWSGTGGG